MANLYARFDFVIRTKGGQVAAGAPLTVRRLSDNALASIYSSDNLTGPLPNPIYSDTNGVISFFAGDLTDDYTFTLPNDLTWTVAGGPADTVHNHRTTGEHADGVITANQLADGIIGNTTDVAIHEAKVRDVHGVPNTLGTEGFAYSTVGGATNDPTFGTMKASAITGPTGSPYPTFLGATFVPDPVNDLAGAITAATAGDTLLLPEGTHTFSSKITVNKSLTIRGMGKNTILANSSATVMEITSTDPVTIQDLTLSGTAQIGLDISNSSTQGTRVHNCDVTATNAVALRVSGAIRMIQVKDCRLVNTGGSFGLEVAGTSVATGIILIEGNYMSGSSGGCSINAPTTNAYGGTLIGNYIVGLAYVCTAPNFRHYGNVIDTTAVTLNSSSVPCLLPANGNVITGTVTDSTYQYPFVDWEYSSSWIDVDNSGSAVTDAFFKVGTTGIGGTFNHNLGTKQLEYMVQVSENSGGGGRRWTIMGGTVSQADSQVAPVYEAFGLNIRDANNVDLMMYAGDHQTGSGTTASSSKTIFSTVDTTAIQTAARDAYNYGAAGGDALDRVWVKLFLRRAP